MASSPTLPFSRITTEYADTENEDVAPDNPDNPKHPMGTGRAWGTADDLDVPRRLSSHLGPKP